MTTIVHADTEYTITLASGGHDTPDGGMCLLEAVAFIAREPFSDHPACTSPILGAFGRSLNDVLPDDKRQRLVPFIPRLIGTAGDGLDQIRGLLAADWLIRTCTPTWLRLAGLEAVAVSLETLPRQATWDDVEAAVPVVRVAKEKASAAWGAVGSAAWGAVGSAAWSAAGGAARDAAWGAVGSAAWGAVGSAAWDAAWSAARSAAWDAAWDAAWAAAWAAARSAARAAARDAARAAALDALRPTVDALQDSAIELYDRMIDGREQ